jgi:anti-sigma B factor antagonist
VLVTASGEIDMATAPKLRAAILAQVNGKPVDIVVDLSAVSFLDSSGIAALVAGYRRVEETGGAFTVRNPQARVQRVLQLSGLANVFAIGAA